MWEHQGLDLAERQREGPVLRHDLFTPVQGSVWGMANGTSFGLNDLEALMNVACETKELMTQNEIQHRAFIVKIYTLGEVI